MYVTDGLYIVDVDSILYLTKTSEEDDSYNLYMEFGDGKSDIILWYENRDERDAMFNAIVKTLNATWADEGGDANVGSSH